MERERRHEDSDKYSEAYGFEAGIYINIYIYIYIYIYIHKDTDSQKKYTETEICRGRDIHTMPYKHRH